MNRRTEVELKFLVPPGARSDVLAALAPSTRGADAPTRLSLAAQYLDTPHRVLARAGIAWRLRREGRRWVQTLKAAGSTPLERFEHEVVRPSAIADAALHAGTPVGDRLIELLRDAKADGATPAVRFRTRVRRTLRRVRTRGAVVEIAFDEGTVTAGEASQRIREIEFELISGSAVAMLGLVERWRARFGLLYDPRSKAERGDALADGVAFAPLRKAAQVRYDASASAPQAFGAVFDECLAQVTRNALGLVDGDIALRVDHVHQLRVGIRRLRSALRSFRSWVEAPPDALVEGLRTLFATLGAARDADVLGSGVMAQLAASGAPPLQTPPGPPGPDPAQAIRAGDTQRLLLAWIAWRAAWPAVAGTPPPEHDAPRPLRRAAARRLRRWHTQLAADWHAFDALDETALHDLRKRIKRQRYAVEFFAPLLRRRDVARYLDALTAIQDRMGALTDLFVARARCRAITPADPAAWYALGWLAARIDALRARAKPALAQLVEAAPPRPRTSG